MSIRRIAWLVPLLPLIPLVALVQSPSAAYVVGHGTATVAPDAPAEPPDRSPVDLVFADGERFLLTANQTSNSISVVDVASGKVLQEAACGERPSNLALTPDGRTLLVSCTFAGTVESFHFANGTLMPGPKVELRFEPRGLAISPDGRTAYVGLTTAAAIAVLELPSLKEVARIATGRWPRTLALSGDGTRLAVGVSGDGGIAVIDTTTRKQEFIEDFIGLNLGQMQVDRAGKFVYAPWMIYRHNPITPTNIRIGWVLASRIARVRLDKAARREAISLDPQGEAVADPFGLALSPDEQWLVCAASGTHELLVYKLPGLPFQDYGGPGDHIDAALLQDKDRFYRIPLGGRPMFVRYSRDGKRVYVANYLLNAIQVVDVARRTIERTIPLGGPKEPSLARRGEAIFYDGKRSLDQWYSCASCHYEGHTNAVSMDTRNDGRFGNFKMVLSLRNVTKTGPWTWHGWQDNLEFAMRKSLTDSMLGPEPSLQDVQALVAYLDTLKHPRNPYRQADGSLSPAAQRGEAIFHSERANCASCHSGEYFTNGKLYRVGTGEPGDVYKSYNPPSLIGTYDRIKWLHDGRAKTLRDVLTGPHSPERVSGQKPFTDAELDDLLAYLRSL